MGREKGNWGETYSDEGLLDVDDAVCGGELRMGSEGRGGVGVRGRDERTVMFMKKSGEAHPKRLIFCASCRGLARRRLWARRRR